MKVQLDQEELEIVVGVLRAQMQELPTQARHTDDARYLDELRHLQGRTKALLSRLENALGGGTPTLRA